MAEQSEKSALKVAFAALAIVLFGAAIYTIETASWAQPVRHSIATHGPHALMHYYFEHKKPHIPKLPKLKAVNETIFQSPRSRPETVTL